MSAFGKIFGDKKDPKSLTTGGALEKLRETEEMLVKKQEFLEMKIEQEISTARKNRTDNKRVALQALKRKNRYEKQLQQIDGTLSTLEMQREALEGATTNTAVLQSMGEAAKALKAAHQNIDVDKIHDMMDDIADEQVVAREISDAISNTTAFEQDVDEDELERELEELEQAELDKEMLSLEPNVVQGELKMPDVPNSKIAAAAAVAGGSRKNARPVAKEEEDDMRELEMWAS